MISIRRYATPSFTPNIPGSAYDRLTISLALGKTGHDTHFIKLLAACRVGAQAVGRHNSPVIGASRGQTGNRRLDFPQAGPAPNVVWTRRKHTAGERGTRRVLERDGGAVSRRIDVCHEVSPRHARAVAVHVLDDNGRGECRIINDRDGHVLTVSQCRSPGITDPHTHQVGIVSPNVFRKSLTCREIETQSACISVDRKLVRILPTCDAVSPHLTHIRISTDHSRCQRSAFHHIEHGCRSPSVAGDDGSLIHIRDRHTNGLCVIVGRRRCPVVQHPDGDFKNIICIGILNQIEIWRRNKGQNATAGVDAEFSRIRAAADAVGQCRRHVHIRRGDRGHRRGILSDADGRRSSATIAGDDRCFIHIGHRHSDGLRSCACGSTVIGGGHDQVVNVIGPRIELALKVWR